MATLDDFLQRFAGIESQSISDEEATQYYDRFASPEPKDRDFDSDSMYYGATEYLAQMPEDEFQKITRGAYSQTNRQQQEDLLGGVLGALQNHGVGLSRLGNILDLSSTDPRHMTPDDYARVANYARREYPDAMCETVREQSWFIKALGNAVVLGTLATTAARMLKQSRK